MSKANAFNAPLFPYIFEVTIKYQQGLEVREAYSKVGIDPKVISTEEFNKYVKEEISRYQKIAATAQIEQQ